MKYYYAGANNQTTGPVTVEEIQALIQNGTLKSDPMVVPEGGKDWRPLSTFTMGSTAGGPPPPPPPNAGSVAAEKAVAASKDAVSALGMFATNPVGGLAPSYEALGPAKAMNVGIAFGVVSVVILLLMAYRMTSGPFSTHDFGFFMKALVFGIVPFGSAFVIGLLARTVSGGGGGFDRDCFIAGASVLPLVGAGFIMMLLGASGGDFNNICSVFALCLTVLMLFSGFTRISKVPERLATFLVPCVILVIAYVAVKMLMSLMFHGMGAGMGGMMNM